MKILDSIDELSEKIASLLLFKSFLFDNHLKKFALRYILHHEKQLLRSLYDLVELDEIGMSDLFQNVDLPCNSLDVRNITNFALLQNFDCNFFPRERMDPKFHLPERTLAKVASKDVISDGATSWECAFFLLFRHE